MNWTHLVAIGLGAALPVVTTWLEGQPIWTLPELGKVLSTALLVGVAAVMKGVQS